jgi:hypothetical protein
MTIIAVVILLVLAEEQEDAQCMNIVNTGIKEETNDNPDEREASRR